MHLILNLQHDFAVPLARDNMNSTKPALVPSFLVGGQLPCTRRLSTVLDLDQIVDASVPHRQIRATLPDSMERLYGGAQLAQILNDLLLIRVDSCCSSHDLSV